MYIMVLENERFDTWPNLENSRDSVAFSCVWLETVTLKPS